MKAAKCPPTCRASISSTGSSWIFPATLREIAAGSHSQGVTPRGKPAAKIIGGARHGINDYTGWFVGDEEMRGDYHGYDGSCPPWNDARVPAFIPTNKNDAVKVRWGAMPYDAILQTLLTKTGGRVIRADDAWLATINGKPDFAYPSGSILDVHNGVRDAKRGPGGLWVEVDLA